MIFTCWTSYNQNKQHYATKFDKNSKSIWLNPNLGLGIA